MTIPFCRIETGNRGRGYYDTVTFALLLLLTVFASKDHNCPIMSSIDFFLCILALLISTTIMARREGHRRPEDPVLEDGKGAEVEEEAGEDEDEEEEEPGKTAAPALPNTLCKHPVSQWSLVSLRMSQLLSDIWPFLFRSLFILFGKCPVGTFMLTRDI